MGIVDELRKRANVVVEELGTPAGDPNARSVDNNVATVRSSTTEKHRLEKETLERYWDLYTNVPIVREPIRSFSGEVIESGYYVDAEDEELKELLEEWLGACAILEAEVDRDFSDLVKKAIVQREVKGTCLIEKVYTEEDDDVLYGFKLMKPETVRAFTYPGKSVLLDPDDDEITEEAGSSRESFELRWSDYTLKRTDDGSPAAYVQYDEELTSSIDREYEIPFKRDDVIKLTRDADAGEPFGTSRLAAAEDRIESLLKKLEDNDKAIESLAHPFQLFQFGSEDDVWSPSKIQKFMNQHKDADFEPGMKQGVQGDVSVQTVSGEVADIEEFLQFDIDWIISEMPLPKYALGGFEQDVNQFVSRSQETRVEKQINDAKREIQDEFTPVLQQKAKELGYSEEDVNGLVLGQDPEEIGIEDIKEEEEGQQNNTGASGTDFTRPPASSEESRQETEENSAATVEELEVTDEELEKRTSAEEDLSEIAYNTLTFVRDRLVDKIDEHGRTRPEHAVTSISSGYERVIEQESSRMFAGTGNTEFEELFRNITQEVVAEVDELSDSPVSANHSDFEISDIYRDNYVDSVERTAESIAKDILQDTRRTLTDGGSVEEIKSRVLEEHSDKKLRNRANLIAHMERHDAEQTVKMSKFKQAEDIIGFRISNDSDDLTPVCSHLTGETGESVEVYFSDSVQEQLSNAVPESVLHKGFDPLPRSPPYHFKCDSEIEPIYEQ